MIIYRDYDLFPHAWVSGQQQIASSAADLPEWGWICPARLAFPRRDV